MLAPTPLPVDYTKLTGEQRKLVRERYARKQENLCWHCGMPLDRPVPEVIAELPIDWGLFPSNFRDYPNHLHHNHRTGMTIGTVHALCNAVLWQYHGE